MILDVFTQGALEMSGTPIEPIASQAMWGDLLVNRILAAVAIVILIIDLTDIFDLFPHIKDCIIRSRGNISLEHSVSIARSRNFAAAALALPFCLVADRFRLYNPAFWQHIPQGWSAPATIGVLVALVLLMAIIYALTPLRHMSSEDSEAMHRSSFTYFIVLSIIVLATVGIMYLCKKDDSVIRSWIYWETGIVYLFSLLRAGQILAADYSGLGTFLYLCALKILAPGILVASAFVL